VTLQVGQVVRWRNDDAPPHNAVGPGFNTGTLAQGQTSQDFTFSSPGQLNYECTIHLGQMSGGRLIVQ
jgi:plastocyanin